MACYEVKWREVYEMKAVVSAASLEAAMAAGADLMNNTPSLDFFEEWKGDEAVTYTEVGQDSPKVKVEAEMVDKQSFTCLPVGGFVREVEVDKDKGKDEQ